MMMDTHPLALGLRVSGLEIWFLFVRVGIRSNIWTGLYFFVLHGILGFVA